MQLQQRRYLSQQKDTTFPLIISCYSRNRNFNFSQLSPKGYLTIWSPKSQKQQCLRFAMCITHTLYKFPLVAQNLPWQKTNISTRHLKTGVQDGLEHSRIQIQSQRSPWVVPIMCCVCVFGVGVTVGVEVFKSMSRLKHPLPLHTKSESLRKFCKQTISDHHQIVRHLVSQDWRDHNILFVLYTAYCDATAISHMEPVHSYWPGYLGIFTVFLVSSYCIKDNFMYLCVFTFIGGS